MTPLDCDGASGKPASTKVVFDAPRVELDQLSFELKQWADERLVPKILVATQSRVIEAIVDESGDLLPSVPVETFEAEDTSLWDIAALLSSPHVSAIAATRLLGSALSDDALKLSAQDLLSLPLPRNDRPWRRAGLLFQEASGEEDQSRRLELLRESASEMCRAYAVDDASDLLRWWMERLPRPRAGEVASHDVDVAEV